MTEISSLNRHQLITVGNRLLAHINQIKKLRQYASYMAKYQARIKGVSFTERCNDRLEALKDDLIRAKNYEHGSVLDLKRILKDEITTIKEYKFRKTHPKFAKQHDDRVRRGQADMNRAGDVYEAKIERKEDLKHYQTYAQMADRFKQKAKNISVALENKDYDKLKQILDNPAI